MSQQVLQWNDTFSYKLKESEWKKPTEEQITNVFLCYLKEFDYDIAKIQQLLNSESKDEVIGIKVRLCNIINKFYKISSDKNIFQYYDLINPTPRKIQHVIVNLMNYYLWYEQTKSKISGKSESILKEFNESRNQLEKINKKQESIRAKTKKLQEDFIKKTKLMPELNMKLYNLNNNLIHLSKKKEDILKSKKNCEDNIEKCKAKYKELEEKIISDDEYIGLLQKENGLEKELAEINSYIEIQQNNKKLKTQQIDEMTPIIEEIENILQINTDSFKVTSDEQLKYLKKEIEEKLKIKKILHDKTEEAKGTIEDEENNFNYKTKDFVCLEYGFYFKVDEMTQSLEEKIKANKEVDKLIAKSNKLLAEEEEIDKFIMKSTEILFNEQPKFSCTRK